MVLLAVQSTLVMSWKLGQTLVVNRVGALTKAIDSVAFYDTLNAGGGLHYNNGTIALRTNEGKLYSPSSATYYTDAHDIADPAWYSTAGAGSDTMIQINMGLNATYAARGKLRSNSRPSFNTNTCIILATYRVTVNGGYGTKVNFGGGAFTYRDTATGVFYTINFPDDSLMVYQSPDACLDELSATNVLGDEVNGTFGAPAGPLGAPQTAARRRILITHMPLLQQVRPTITIMVWLIIQVPREPLIKRCQKVMPPGYTLSGILPGIIPGRPILPGETCPVT
jgi:hypothetical protein